MSETILVVDDEKEIADLVELYLSNEGYRVEKFYEALPALDYTRREEPALAVLDVMLPDMDGFTLCQRIRENHLYPIIMLTALSGEEEQIRGLDLQVDDYITKPFSMPVLVRKIGAVLRRSRRGQEEGHQTLVYRNLVLDLDSYLAAVDGREYELTQREFEILRELLTHQGRVMTRQNLLDRLWRYDFYGDERVVDTHIKNLRKKLGIDFIQTIRGVGYKIEREN